MVGACSLTSALLWMLTWNKAAQVGDARRLIDYRSKSLEIDNATDDDPAVASENSGNSSDVVAEDAGDLRLSSGKWKAVDGVFQTDGDMENVIAGLGISIEREVLMIGPHQPGNDEATWAPTKSVLAVMRLGPDCAERPLQELAEQVYMVAAEAADVFTGSAAEWYASREPVNATNFFESISQWFSSNSEVYDHPKSVESRADFAGGAYSPWGYKDVDPSAETSFLVVQIGNHGYSCSEGECGKYVCDGCFWTQGADFLGEGSFSGSFKKNLELWSRMGQFNKP